MVCSFLTNIAENQKFLSQKNGMLRHDFLIQLNSGRKLFSRIICKNELLSALIFNFLTKKKRITICSYPLFHFIFSVIIVLRRQPLQRYDHFQPNFR